MGIGLDNWAKKYEEATNSDETIKAMAKYYTCSFMFDMESAKVIIEMHDGKIKNINTKPSPLDPYRNSYDNLFEDCHSRQECF